MLEYLEKYKYLPQEVKDSLSSQATLEAIDAIEKEYSLELVSAIIRVAVRDLPIEGLSDALQEEYGLDAHRAVDLENALKQRIFGSIAEHLGLSLERQNFKESTPDGTTQGPSAGEERRHTPFYFSAEDEEDVRGYKDKFTQIAPDPEKAKAEDYINELAAEINIHFSSRATQERFKQLLKTYFFGIRDRLNTKISLGKRFDAGGLGLDEKTINVILDASDRKIAAMKGMAEDGLKEAIHPRKRIEIGGLRDFEYDLKSELEKGNLQKKSRSENPAVPPDTAHEIAPPHPALANVSAAPFPLTEAPVRTSSVPQKTAPIVPTDKIVAFSRPIEPGGKKKMDDVVRPKKEKRQSYKYVMSPIDELKNMDTESFRRIAEDPSAACVKIREKLSLLEEEDYGKKIAGIKAWRQSPIYRLYLAMGQQSIVEKKTMEEVIKIRNSSGSETLSNPEFEAIMDFNKEIRF